MARTLHDKLLGALEGRSVWEERQRLWYEMRHQGIPRRNKPFKGAADLHLPIGDNQVEKQKAYYINSIFGRQVLASFTSLGEQLAEASTAAAEYLDWKLRHMSNYPLETAYLIDLTLLCGNPVMKVRWNPKANGKKGGVVFEAVDPLCFLVPQGSDEIDEMDWFAHIRYTTVAKYQSDERYNQNTDLIARIRGGEKQEAHWKEQEKANREGLTYSKDEDEIVLWEAFERVKEGWRVRTYSPTAKDEPVRPDFILPYKWQGEPMQPFVRARCEITDKGFYAPRGVVEKTAPYETYGTKLWNAKADHLEYSIKPLFRRDPQAALPNTGNITLRPGEILPPGIGPEAMPPPPFAIDQEIGMTRQLAEESAGAPDFGALGQESQQRGKGAGEKGTAKEWEVRSAYASQGIQMKAWISGLTEGEIYRKAWALIVMYGKEDLAYFSGDTRKVLPAQAMHDNYLIRPDASPDAWDKEARRQRSTLRFQKYAGHPNINQEELVKADLADDDPRLVKKLFVSTGNKAANEAEDEAFEITIMMEGYPAQANPGEDHQTRLKILFGKLQQLSLMPWPTDMAAQQKAMIARARLQQHIGQHLMLMKEANPALAKQFVAAIQALDPGQPIANSQSPIAEEGQAGQLGERRALALAV